MEIISIYKKLFDRCLRWCREHIENFVPQMSEFQFRVSEYENSWSHEWDESIERMIVEFQKLMESKAEWIKYQLIESAKLAR